MLWYLIYSIVLTNFPLQTNSRELQCTSMMKTVNHTFEWDLEQKLSQVLALIYMSFEKNPLQVNIQRLLNSNETYLRPRIFLNHLIFFSCASAKAERSLSSLSCVCVYVDQNMGTPQARISWVHTKMLHHFCMTPKFAHDQKDPPPRLNYHGCIW